MRRNSFLRSEAPRPSGRGLLRFVRPRANDKTQDAAESAKAHHPVSSFVESLAHSSTGSHPWFSATAGKAGFGLAEVLISLGIIAVTFGAAITLVSQSFNARRVVRDDLIAANLALEGVELVRAIRDSNWVWSSGGAPAPKTANAIGSSGSCSPAAATWRARLCDSPTDRKLSSDFNPSGGGVLLTGGGSTTPLWLQTNGAYTYCDSTTCPGAKQTKFRRSILLGSPSTTEMSVRVIVRWCPTPVISCLGRERSLTVESRLLNWIPR